MQAKHKNKKQNRHQAQKQREEEQKVALSGGDCLKNKQGNEGLGFLNRAE